MKLRSIAVVGWIMLAVTPVSFGGTIFFDVPTVILGPPYSLTGYLDVRVSESGGSDLLSGFQVDVHSASPYVTFLGADLLTNSTSYNPAPYVYAGNSYDQNEGFPPYATTTEALNVDFPNTGSGPALSSTPLGIIRIEYSVASYAPAFQLLPITLNQDNPNIDSNADFVQLNGNSNDLISPTAYNGGIFITDPEPSSWTLAMLGLAGLFGVGRWARRAKSR